MTENMAKTEQKQETPILSWIGGEAYEDWKEREIADYYKPEGEPVPSDAAFMSSYGDHNQWEWDSFLEELTTLIEENFSGYWHVEVDNFGWQNRCGKMELFADKGRDLLRGILPETDCHFKIFKDDHPGSATDWADGVARPVKGLKIQNYHHDSPVGNEWYHLIDVENIETCSECDKWFPEEDSYESEGLGCALSDRQMCQKCGEAYYEEDDDDKV